MKKEKDDSVYYPNDRVFRLDELIQDVMGEYDEKRNGEYREPGLPTGFPGIDKLLGGGFRPGTVNLIASCSGTGKTALALGMARNMARDGNVLYYSSADPANTLARRILCAESGVDPRALKHGHPSVYLDLHDAEEELRALPLFIFSAQEYPFGGIDEIIPDIGGVRALFVDDLQNAVGRRDTRRGMIAETQKVMIRLKEIAKRFDIPVVVTSQISRSYDGPPRLFEMQIDNEAIERNANTVLFLFRDGYRDRLREDADRAELILAKNAFGDVGKADLLWSERTSSFIDPASESEYSRWMEELASDDDLPF